MDVLIIIGLLILGCLLNCLWEPGFTPAKRLAWVYLALSCIIALSAWLFYFAGIRITVIQSALGVLKQYGGYLSHLLLGFLMANILFKVWMKDTLPDSENLRAMIRTTLWGAAIGIANSFIIATVGKSMNMPYMIGFFKQSGYAVWFLYFIMAAETAGALGILLHVKLRTGMAASLGLFLIMTGAVYTHVHNHDPFSDSYAALVQLINLSTLLLIYYLEKMAGRKPADTHIYII
ncbi:MAG TPA: DoxX family protein [Mucilaginibacter sp.]|nr:DoxX family protein [Mucilaginibacter sp.]